MKNTEEPQTDQQNENEDFIPEYPDGPEIKPKISPSSAAFLGLLGVFILYQFGGSILSFAILGFDIKNADVNAVRLLTSASQILFILLPALILTKTIYVDVTKIIRFNLPKYTEVLLFSVGLIILSMILQSYLFIQNYILIKLAESSHLVSGFKSYFDQINKIVEESYTTLLISNSIIESIVIIFVVAIVPALCEEIFFRGFVQRSFEFKYKPLSSAVITATFFGLYHFHPYQILPLFALGLYFGYAVYKTDSILIPIILHFLNNFIAVMLLLIFGQENIINNSSAAPDDVKVSLAVFTGMMVLFVLFLFYMNKFYFKKEPEHKIRKYF